jgi:hypothetical protein
LDREQNNLQKYSKTCESIQGDFKLLLGFPWPIIFKQKQKNIHCRLHFYKFFGIMKKVMPFWVTLSLVVELGSTTARHQDMWWKHLIDIPWGGGKESVALVCEQTIPTEWPPLVGKVSANFCR